MSKGEPTSPRQRKIIHVDMDAFFAAVEQRDFPEYRGKPLVVGGDEGGRGVVATCSYEARRFGIRSAMPAAHARRLCPDAIFVRPRFAAYREVSRQIHAIFRQYSDLVEPLSLDEAYLDVTACSRHQGSATRIAQAIRRDILTTTGLTASAGVSFNKFLAKSGSDINKPDGQTVVLPDQAEAFVARLPIGDFYGIGKATEQKMNALGIHCGADLRACSRADLQAAFGKSGDWYYQIARGMDPRPVVPYRERKSLGSETTFARDLTEIDDMLMHLEALAEGVIQALQSKGMQAHTVTIKVKYADFEQVTRSHSFEQPIQGMTDLKAWLRPLLGRTEAPRRPVRLLGVSCSGLVERDGQPSQRQMPLFPDLGVNQTKGVTSVADSLRSVRRRRP